MSRDTVEQPPAEPAPEDPDARRRRQSEANRSVAWLLVGTAVMFLAGAVGVALVVTYGPF
jgi:hypothetical protein